MSARTLIAARWYAAVGLLALVVASGCGSKEARMALDEEAIEASLAVFLPILAQAYETGDIEALRPYAAEKELARVEVLVSNLADQGRYLGPTFKQLTIEKVSTWNNSNAFVTTYEVWDVRMYALGTTEVLAEDLDTKYRVKYQLKQDGERWRVLFRAIQEPQ